jgi:sensor histidine kinase YesM
MKYLEGILNLLFWLFTSYLIVSDYSIEVQEIEVVNGKEIQQVFRNQQLVHYFVIGQVVFATIFYIILGFVKSFDLSQKNLFGVLKVLIVTILCLLFYRFIVTQFIFEKHFRMPVISYGIFGFYSVSAVCYGFIKKWMQNERDKKQLELVKNQAELQLIKSQLQPHFLFNTLNNLLAMVDQQNNPKLAKSIDTLSSLLRYVVYDTKKAKVSIKEEINFIKDFAALHLLRFEEEEVDFNFNIKGNYNQQKIEPGILICYIENAFKHGVAPEEEAFIRIDIDISNPNKIHFQIENSIASILNAHQEGGFGLAANAERLQLAYPNKHRIRFFNQPTFKVALTIDTNESNNH